MKKNLIFSILAVVSIFTVSVRAHAMESQQYQIQSEEVTAETPSSEDTVSAGVALNPVDQATFNKNGFIVSSSPSTMLAFSLDDTNISFGSLPQSKPVVVVESVHVSSPLGFSLSMLESRPLTSLSGSTLARTKCDNGCSSKHASLWQNNQSYGLGYSVQGEGAAEDFLDANYFRALSDSSQEQFLKSLPGKTKSDTQLSFKLNPPPQNTDNYSTIITIQALPAY
jgi:hypothetical protein